MPSYCRELLRLRAELLELIARGSPDLRGDLARVERDLVGATR